MAEKHSRGQSLGSSKLAPSPLARRLAPLSALACLLVVASIAAWSAWSGHAPVDARAEEAPHLSNAPPPKTAPEGMAWIPGGTFWMGDPEANFGDAHPQHLVELDGFWMDKTEVTNAQFARFVEATDYRTVAEQVPDPRDVPGAPPEKLRAGSLVFTPPAGQVALNDYTQWWRWVEGANWRHPEGPDSDIGERQNHPVVQVCWTDAAAYAKWAGKRLPTEAQWEFAARGGLDRMPYVWGDKLQPHGKWQSNIWQGHFPDRNDGADGFRGAAPVGSFPANGYGLFDMSGNVWEWCSDWYRPTYYRHSPRKNPPGPDDSFDPLEPGIAKRVQRGGSFLCSDEYCIRYLPAGRGKGDILSAATHLGFRCVRDAE